ncbi:hypothetical protein [Burkholderia gladioli]|uniref:hypothetical protein n=1 Tax=Burkholderia gladioli TaxID=28095 RepID=UPI000A614656|nr:hypothetical protein [Burkholderia gladioli]
MSSRNRIFGCHAGLAFQNATCRIAGYLIPAILLSTGCEASPPTQATSAADLPADVVAFEVQRDQRDHYRGEDPGDDVARAAKLRRELQQTCQGTDARLKALRHRYAGNPKVTAALAHYENDVE